MKTTTGGDVEHSGKRAATITLMDFRPDPELENIGHEARRLADQFDDEYWRDHDERHEFPWDFYNSLRAIRNVGNTVSFFGESNSPNNIWKTCCEARMNLLIEITLPECLLRQQPGTVPESI